MPPKKISENKNTQRKTRGRADAIPWKYCLLTLGCGAILVVGFFFAARQHFSSIDFGIKNSKLRKQIENLESEKRRFILAKEIALSPAEIKKAAQKLGFREMSASNIEVYRPVGDAKNEAKITPTENPKSKDSDEVSSPKKVEKKTETKREENKSEKKTTDAKEKSRPQIAKK